MSGTVYRKPAPGEPIFVKEGDKVAVGQSICIIEVRPGRGIAVFFCLPCLPRTAWKTVVCLAASRATLVPWKHALGSQLFTLHKAQCTWRADATFSAWCAGNEADERD